MTDPSPGQDSGGTESTPQSQPAAPPASTRRRTVAVLIPCVSLLTGGGLGIFWFHHWGAAAVGLLVGLVIGLEMVRSWIAKPGDPPVVPELTIGPGWIPWLSRLAWTGVAVTWGWALFAGWLQGEGGGLLLVLVILPVTAFFWLIGGPTVANASERLLQRIATGQSPERDSELARRGMIQSRIMTTVFLLLLLWILSRMFF